MKVHNISNFLSSACLLSKGTTERTEIWSKSESEREKGDRGERGGRGAAAACPGPSLPRVTGRGRRLAAESVPAVGQTEQSDSDWTHLSAAGPQSRVGA